MLGTGNRALGKGVEMEFIFVVIGIVIAWKLFQGLRNAIDPARAYKIATRRYMEDPTDRNFAAMQKASRRVP